MKRLKVYIVGAVILFLSGCSDFVMICSLNPFYMDKNVTLVPQVEGKWNAIPWKGKSKSSEEGKSPVWNKADTSSIWKIERVIWKQTEKNSKGKDSTVIRPQKFYEVKLLQNRADSADYQFKMVLFRIKNILYADFMPEANTILEKSRFASESYFSIHTLARVDLKNDRMEISWLGDDYMKKMIENKRVRVNYRWVESAKRLLLTGTPDQLTAMIERYAGETRFIDWEEQQAMLMLNRIK